MTSETPKVDAELHRHNVDGLYYVSADFARQLERQNAALRHALELAVEAIHTTSDGQVGDALTAARAALASQEKPE